VKGEYGLAAGGCKSVTTFTSSAVPEFTTAIVTWINKA
jgi:hypothetical protein